MTFSGRTANRFICSTMWTCPCHGENCRHIQWHNSKLVYLSYIVELSLWQRKKLPTQSMAVQGTGFSVLHCADTPAPVRGSVHIRLKRSTNSNLAQRNQQEKIDETASFALVPFWSCFHWLQPCSYSLLHTATQYIIISTGHLHALQSLKPSLKTYPFSWVLLFSPTNCPGLWHCFSLYLYFPVGHCSVSIYVTYIMLHASCGSLCCELLQ